MWQFAVIGATATGVVFVTLAISYFVPVASALAEGRQLRAYISSLGDTPEGVLGQAWAGGSGRGLEQHLVALTPMVHALAERHLTYPILQYLHCGRERTSTALSLTTLDEAGTLLRWGVAPEARPDPVTVEPLARAIGWYLDTVPGAFVSGASEPLPPPDLDALRRVGIPTVATTSSDRPSRTGDQGGASCPGCGRRRLAPSGLGAADARNPGGRGQLGRPCVTGVAGVPLSPGRTSPVPGGSRTGRGQAPGDCCAHPDCGGRRRDMGRTIVVVVATLTSSPTARRTTWPMMASADWPWGRRPPGPEA